VNFPSFLYAYSLLHSFLGLAALFIFGTSTPFSNTVAIFYAPRRTGQDVVRGRFLAFNAAGVVGMVSLSLNVSDDGRPFVPYWA
jgi:hypothetical protein